MRETKETFSRKKVIGHNGIIEPASYQKSWKLIETVCRTDEDLQDIVMSIPGIMTTDNRKDFIDLLEDGLKGINDMVIPELDTGYTDVTGSRIDPGINRKADYLYHLYQIVCGSRNYRKDIADFFNSLLIQIVSTALLSDACLWDVKRQNSRVDTQSCAFAWRSCTQGATAKSGDLLKIAAEDVNRDSSYSNRNTLFVSADAELLNKAEEICGWQTHLYIDESADVLSHAICETLHLRQ